MLLDQTTVLSEAQSLSASAPSTHVMDLTAAGNCVPGSLFFAVHTVSGFSGTGNLGVSLQTSNTSDFATCDTLLSASFPAALVARNGQTLCELPVPQGLKRYVRAYYTVPNTLSGGSVTCFVTDGVSIK